jgi:hypothetical protein
MSLFNCKSFQVLCAFFALSAFTADVLDDICDRSERALAGQVSHSSGQHKGTCPNCAGHNHDEAAIIGSSFAPLSAPRPELLNWSIATEGAPFGVPASIDHPPQLA